MDKKGLAYFEKIVRLAPASQANNSYTKSEYLHPFDERNIHDSIRKHALNLFDNGHYAQATFECWKWLDKQLQKLSGLHLSGSKLMMEAFRARDKIT